MDWRNELRASWAILTPAISPAEYATFAVHGSDGAISAWAAKGLDGSIHLLLPVGSTAEISVVADSKALAISGRMLAIGKTQSGAFVDIQLLEDRLGEVFIGFAADVCAEVDAGADAATTPKVVLERWRDLIDRRLARVLRFQEAVGLFGELSILEGLLSKEAIRASDWTGPIGHYHDFVLPSRAIEVKTTTAVVGAVVEIHGIRQLEAPPDRPLDLAFVRLRPDAHARSLAELACGLEPAIAESDEYQRLCATVGLFLDEPDRYDAFRFEVADIRLLRVGDSLPRIVSTSFTAGEVPRGIDQVTYTTDLGPFLAGSSA